MTSASIATAKINIINIHIANIVIIHIANIAISLINRKKNQQFERLKSIAYDFYWLIVFIKFVLGNELE